MMGPGGGMGGAWGFGFLWPLLWLLVVAGVVLGAAYLFTRTGAPDDSNRAMELLRERYARGEISDEEFDERAARLASPER